MWFADKKVVYMLGCAEVGKTSLELLDHSSIEETSGHLLIFAQGPQPSRRERQLHGLKYGESRSCRQSLVHLADITYLIGSDGAGRSGPALELHRSQPDCVPPIGVVQH
jgi:hypothetical protein